MDEGIVNKVAQSGLIQFDLSKHWPDISSIEYDIAADLWQGIALKEKTFREKLKETDWQIYQGKYVALNCSIEAIIPTWAFMLIANYLIPVAEKITFGTMRELNNAVIAEVINQLDLEPYRDGRIIIKGCSNLDIDDSAYVLLMSKLQPVAKSILFGEPCSTVPLFRRK